MTQEMKTPRNILFLVLLAVPCVCIRSLKDCPKFNKVLSDLTCYNDYNHTITCMWNGTSLSDHQESECTMHAEHKFGIRSSCTVEPVVDSTQPHRKCSMTFQFSRIFSMSDNITLSLNCSNGKQILKIFYLPACHKKLNPPPKPQVNYTTISWFPQVASLRITDYRCQVQWKKADQLWSEIQPKQSAVRDCSIPKKMESCKAEFHQSDFFRGETYEARVRVQDSHFLSTWSEWSPTRTWVSLIGELPPPPPPPSGVAKGVWGISACVAVFALLFILSRTDKTTWLCVVKRIRGPPLPHPGKSFLQDVNFQNGWSPYFTNDALHSFSKSSEIVSVEMSSTVDDATPIGSEATQLEKRRNESHNESSGSGFSNPSYSHLSHASLHVLSLRAGNLEPCSSDTPYGPVGCQGDGETAEQHSDEGRRKEVEILQLFSNGSNNSEPVLLVSDYEKVDKHHVERVRFQSLDSGVCSGEEVSQESLEADSINTTDHHDEGPEGSEEQESGNETETHLHKLFGGSAGVFKSAPLQVCSGYEQVQKLLASSPETPHLDSHFHSQGEEQVSLDQKLQEVEKPTQSTSLLLPPIPSCTLASALASLAPLPVNFSGTGLSPSLRPLPCQILERIAAMSSSRPVEPSGDGYMPVRQEQD